MIIHRWIMLRDPLTTSRGSPRNELPATDQRLDIELEGCGLVVAAGGYLCSVPKYLYHDH